MKVIEAIKLIQKDGWYQVRQKGSHRQFKHGEKKGTVTVAGKESMDLDKGTEQSILRQAGLKQVDWVYFYVMLQYLAVIERAPNNYSAFFPDVPGCIAAGATVDETLQNLQEGLLFHFEGMLEDGNPLPKPQGWLYHYQNGTFKEGEIADTYLLANIAVEEQKLAA